MTLQTERVRGLEEVRAFVEGSEAVDFAVSDRAGIYRLIRRTLVQLKYHRLGKADLRTSPSDRPAPLRDVGPGRSTRRGTLEHPAHKPQDRNPLSSHPNHARRSHTTPLFRLMSVLDYAGFGSRARITLSLSPVSRPPEAVMLTVSLVQAKAFGQGGDRRGDCYYASWQGGRSSFSDCPSQKAIAALSFGPLCPACVAHQPSCCARFGTRACEIASHLGCSISTQVPSSRLEP